MISAELVWFKEHAPDFSGPLSFDEPLSKYTYYRIGGPAQLIAQPKTRADLDWLAEGMRQHPLPVFILGAGSNLLVADAGFAGLVIRTAKLNLTIQKSSDMRLQVGASVPVSMLLRRCAQEGWGGLEFLTGVPGWIGGVVRMNAGTHLGEAKDRLRRLTALVAPLNSSMSGSEAPAVWSEQVFEPSEMQFSYRHSHFLPKDSLIWSTEWEITPAAPDQVKALIDETLARRKASQPVDYPSCGSVFKNPKAHGKLAWQVIDALGLRGYQIGAAQFAQKHSNFIINLGSARASDVRALIELAKTRALKEMGIPLEEEVLYLGF